MSGAGNDAPPITLPASYHLEQSSPLPFNHFMLKAPENGNLCQSSDMATQTPVLSQQQDVPANMARDIDSVKPPKEAHPPRIRIHFDDFAAQNRLHRQKDRHARMLRLRKESLQRSIALTQRLHRVGRSVQDGLVFLAAQHNDTVGFARVYHSMNEISDTFHARCKLENWPKDELLNTSSTISDIYEEFPSFISKISPGSRGELSRLLHSVRSEPSFLIERIKALSQMQLDSLCLVPGEDTHTSVLPSFPPARSSTSHGKRRYAISFEDYAVSLERKHPLTFMLCNAYGDSHDMETPEYWLRLNTWSTVCSELFLSADASNQAQRNKLISRIFVIFASLHGWRASERLQLFLMDVLQRGAVLLELVDRTPSSKYRNGITNPFGTPEAEAFFEEAVQQLVAILFEHDGGLPQGTLQFACVTLGKMTSERDQTSFRGFVFWQWFVDEFLRIVIEWPETQDMLFKCYISKSARQNILAQLWHRTRTRMCDVYDPTPSKPVPHTFRIQVESMIAKLDTVQIPTSLQPSTDQPNCSVQVPRRQGESLCAYLMICPTDVINLIDILCPQPSLATTGLDPFMMWSANTFQNQYKPTKSNSKSNFDQLRRDLADLTQPSISLTSHLVHPCQETWTVCCIGSDGKLDLAETITATNAVSPGLGLEQHLEPEDLSRKAALRLATEHRRSSRSLSPRHTSILQTLSGNSLVELFDNECRYAQDRADTAAAHYWHQAVKHLHQRYPASREDWGLDDTAALRGLVDQCEESQSILELQIAKLDNQILDLQDYYRNLRKSIAEASGRMDRLRDRLWYTMDVINSKFYENAKNIVSALNNMSASSMIQGETFGDVSDTISLSGSLFSQLQKDTIGMLKAPSEHGGPKKLADAQLDLINRWLSRNTIENFCKGEERFHRFCMEIKSLVKKLAAENLHDSPDLWSSDLYKKERDICFEISGNPAVTRPASVKSETYSSTYHTSRGSHHGFEQGPRLSGFDAFMSPARKTSFHSVGSTRIKTEGLPSDTFSFTNGSPDRAYSSGASESTLQTLYSPIAPQSQSVTTMSSRSRPPSTYNDIENAKIADQTAKEKSKFLEDLQQELTCLLLSDLGCPVWSCGSETDARLASVCADSRIAHRMRQRQVSSRLLSKSQRSGIQPKQKRSTSAAPQKPKNMETFSESAEQSRNWNQIPGSVLPYSYTQAYQALLDKFSQQVDPMDKLQAIYDLKLLVLAELKDEAERSHSVAPTETTSRVGRSAPTSRRGSFDPSTSYSPKNDDTNSRIQTLESTAPLEASKNAKLQEAFKKILQGHKSKTLFRDLQYVSVFVPSDILNSPERGGAFTDFGLAALAYKKDVAQAMADVADRIIADDLAKKESQGEAVKKIPGDATQLLLLAAQEGNDIAQREVASLYLSQPELMQIVSKPLSLPNETFKHEMMWREKKGLKTTTNTQAMCLALHWMQLAANQGDTIAREKLIKMKKEAAEGDHNSIR